MIDSALFALVWLTLVGCLAVVMPVLAGLTLAAGITFAWKGWRR